MAENVADALVGQPHGSDRLVRNNVSTRARSTMGRWPRGPWLRPGTNEAVGWTLIGRRTHRLRAFVSGSSVYAGAWGQEAPSDEAIAWTSG